LETSDAPDLEFEDDRLRRLFAYWTEKCGSRLFPGRPDVDPVDFSYVLGYVTLVEVERDPLRYRFRLDGSILVDLSGTDYTGRYLDDLPGAEYVAFIKDSYDRVVESGKPHCYRKRGLFDQQYFSEETLILPLGKAPPKVEMLMVAVIPGDLSQPEDGKVVI
jgi:hypothetical protein